MIQTGLLAFTILVAGFAGPAGADATQGWSHAKSLLQAPAEAREAARDDVISPPDPGIDPEMAVTPPAHAGTMRVIPRRGGPGGDKGAVPR